MMSMHQHSVRHLKGREDPGREIETLSTELLTQYETSLER